MNFFKKLLFIIILFLLPLIGYSNINNKTPNLVQGGIVLVKGFTLSNPTCNGCASFYYRIYRSARVNHYGSYEYYIYLKTNSYYSNGVLAYTYVPNINVYCDGYKVGDPFYSIVYNEVKVYIVYSTNPYSRIILKWGYPLLY